MLPATISIRPDVESGANLVKQRHVRLKPSNDLVTPRYAVPRTPSTRRSRARRSSCCSACSAARALALLAGLFVSERAMSPIKQLTARRA